MSRPPPEPAASCPIFDAALERLGTRRRATWGAPEWEIPTAIASSIADHIASEWNDFAREMEDGIESARSVNAKLREWAHAEIAAKDAEIESHTKTIRELESRIEELEREADALQDQLNASYSETP